MHPEGMYTRSDIHKERQTHVREIHTKGTCTCRGHTPGRDMHMEGTYTRSNKDTERHTHGGIYKRRDIYMKETYTRHEGDTEGTYTWKGHTHGGTTHGGTTHGGDIRTEQHTHVRNTEGVIYTRRGHTNGETYTCKRSTDGGDRHMTRHG